MYNRPARIVSYDQKTAELILHNYMDFDDLKDYIDIAYEVTQDGLSIQKGKLKSFSAAPHCDGKTTLNIAVPEVGRIYLKLTYMLKKEIPLMEKKQVLGFDELKLDNQDSRNTMVARLLEQEQKGSETSWTKMIMS